jgi:hypothetical protein
MNATLQATDWRISGSPLSAAERSNRWVGIGTLLLFLLYAFLVDPEKVHSFRCIFKELTGWNCLACGLTHSLYASTHLHWSLAMRYHFFGPALFFAAVGLLVYWIWEVASGKKGALRINVGCCRRGAILIGFLWLIYWLSRLLSTLPGVSF